jgi:hypothetical protein
LCPSVSTPICNALFQIIPGTPYIPLSGTFVATTIAGLYSCRLFPYCDIFQDNVFAHRLPDTEELMARIRQEIRTIINDNLRGVVDNFSNRPQHFK